MCTGTSTETSLAHSLRSAVRARIPEATLSVCNLKDRMVVENIVTLLAESMHLNVTQTAIVRDKQTYKITIPMPRETDLSLSDLRQVEAYSPARIMDISVLVRSGSPSLIRCVVNDESAPVLVSETDVLRVTKRRRWW